MGYDTKKERWAADREDDRLMRAARKREQHSAYLYTHLWPALYRRFSFRPISDKLMLFASAESASITPELRPVFDALKSKDYRCVFVGKFEYDGAEFLRRVAEYKYYKDFFKLFARCKCLYLDDSFSPAYSQKPREGQKIVQLWHSFGMLKHWDYSVKSRRSDSRKIDLRPIHSTYTDVSVASDAAKPSFAAAFGCGEELLHAWGVAKTDCYLKKDFVADARDILIKNVPNLLSRIDGRKILLYAPTYRGDSRMNPRMHTTLDLSLMQRLLGDDYILLIKPHPHIDQSHLFDDVKDLFEDFLFVVPKFVPTNMALCGSDMLITDYSSIMFEYALLGRPMIFYAYDLQQYKKEHEFIVKYEHFVPGPVVYDSLMLADAVRVLEGNGFDPERVRHFRKKYLSGCDGHSTGRIISFTTK